MLFTLLVYITLDLSLPSIPGAFVFDPVDSVESVQMGRGRHVIDVARVYAPTHEAARDDVDGLSRGSALAAPAVAKVGFIEATPNARRTVMKHDDEGIAIRLGMLATAPAPIALAKLLF